MALIVIIDDDPDIIEASSLVLTTKGHDVIAANNPDEGYEVVIDKKPDLIILDVMMDEPDDGFFLAQKFRREKITTPILMYTSVFPLPVTPCNNIPLYFFSSIYFLILFIAVVCKSEKRISL